MKRPRLAREIVEIAAITLVLFLIVHFTIQAYQVGDTSMQNSLHGGQSLLVNRVAYLFHAPERGDVIVLRDPTNTNNSLLRRIIGIPGDSVSLDGSTVSVNGVQLNEPYVAQKFNPGAEAVKVPPGAYFVLPDNRLTGPDSRSFGVVPANLIIGRAIMVYWPFNQWQWVNTYSLTYAGVK